MNSAHWHLLLNHIPVLGIWFGVAWLIGAIVLRNPPMIRVSWITFIVCAAATIPVYLTGEPAEDMVENLLLVSKPIIEQHESAAKIALIAIEALGALALVSLVVSRRQEKWMRPLAVLSLGLALLCGGIAGYTASLGGQARHAEIRPASTPGDTPALNNRQTREGQEHEE